MGRLVKKLVRAIMRAVGMEDARVSRLTDSARNNRTYLRRMGEDFTGELIEEALDRAYDSSNLSDAADQLFDEMQESMATAWASALNGALHNDYDRNSCRALIRSGQWDEIASEHETRCERALRDVLLGTAESWSGEYD